MLINAVGYQKPGTITGVQMVIPTFTDVAKGDKVMLSKIEVTGYEDVYDGFEGIVMMTKVNELGFSRNDGSFENPIQWDYVAYIDENGWQKFWVDSLGSGEPIVPGEEVGEQIVQPGEGLYIDCSENDATISVIFPSPVANHDAE